MCFPTMKHKTTQTTNTVKSFFSFSRDSHSAIISVIIVLPTGLNFRHLCDAGVKWKEISWIFFFVKHLYTVYLTNNSLLLFTGKSHPYPSIDHDCNSLKFELVSFCANIQLTRFSNSKGTHIYETHVTFSLSE